MLLASRARVRRGHWLGWAVLAAIAAGSVRVASFRLPRARSAARDVHGEYHVHSRLSDGWGTVDEIAAAAAQDGLSFVVVSDHNRLDPQLLGVRDGVLVIPATEESTAAGHVISLGARRALTSAEKRRRIDSLAAIRSVGGVPMIAHPFNLREPFTDWPDVGEAAALETVSFDDVWREALASPVQSGLFIGGLEYPLNPLAGLLQLMRRPSEALARFDRLRADHDLVQLCAADAHGLPGYPVMFRVMSMHIDGLALPLGVEAAPEILSALEEGRAYCALDALAPAAGFRFAAEGPGSTLLEGMQGGATGQILRVQLPALDPPLPAEIHLFRNGVAIRVARAQTLSLPAPGPGDYRVEVWMPRPGPFFQGPPLPWILSNPIRLRAP